MDEGERNRGGSGHSSETGGLSVALRVEAGPHPAGAKASYKSVFIRAPSIVVGFSIATSYSSSSSSTSSSLGDAVK